MVFRTLEQQKMVCIISPKWLNISQGFCDEIPEKIYFDVPYEDDEQVSTLFQKANEIYKEDVKKGSWNKSPQVQYYWKTIEEN